MDRWLRMSAVLLMTALLAACGGASAPEAEPSSSMPTSSESASSQEQPGSAGEESSNASEADVGPLSDYYLEQMASGTYYMKYNILVGGPAVDGVRTLVTFGLDAGRLAMVMETEQSHTAVLALDDKLYMIDHIGKTIHTFDSDVQDEENPPVIAEEPVEIEGLRYVGSGEEDDLTYEEYELEETTTRFYFEGNELKRIVTETPEMRADIDVLEFNTDPPEEMFELPDDYEVTTF